jgi:hypothetical protein
MDVIGTVGDGKNSFVFFYMAIDLYGHGRPRVDIDFGHSHGANYARIVYLLKA